MSGIAPCNSLYKLSLIQLRICHFVADAQPGTSLDFRYSTLLAAVVQQKAEHSDDSQGGCSVVHRSGRHFEAKYIENAVQHTKQEGKGEIGDHPERCGYERSEDCCENCFSPAAMSLSQEHENEDR